MNKKINVGLVGYGMSGQLFHAPFIDADKRFLLKTVVERHQNLASETYPYVNTVRSLDELLEDKSIELIVITTPNIYHYDQVKQCIMAGRDVVIEKPFTPTSTEAQDLIDLANEKDRKLFIYQNRRWDGDFLTIKKILDDGLLGELHEYEAHFDRYTPDLSSKKWREKPDLAGGNLYDLGTHLIDQAVALFGLPKTVYADIRTQRENSLVDDAFEVILNYGQLKVTLKASMLIKEIGARYSLHGSLGSFVKHGIDPQEADLKKGLSPIINNWGSDSIDNYGIINTELNGQNHRESVETEKGCYQDFYSNVFDVLEKGAELSIKPEEAQDVLKIIELAFKSHKTKRIINF